MRGDTLKAAALQQERGKLEKVVLQREQNLS